MCVVRHDQSAEQDCHDAGQVDSLKTDFLIVIVIDSVADPDPSDPYFSGLLDPDPLVRCTDPDPYIIKQK